MAFAKKKTEVPTEINIVEVKTNEITFRVIGRSPLVPHAVSFKAQQELIYPSKKKNQAERDSSMKHNPMQEFRDAAYCFRDEDGDMPTRLYMPAGAFHGAMANAAIDMVGAKKSQIGRLTNIVGDKVPIWGVPKIWTTIVRSSDMKRTPDVRVLPIIPEWVAEFTIEFVDSLIPTKSIANLLVAAGSYIGVGDGRPEKGKLAFGKFTICEPDDAAYRNIVRHGGRAAQDAALKDPAFYDFETERLLSWFDGEHERRVARPTAVKKDDKEKTVLAPQLGIPRKGRGKNGGRSATA